uniref:Uncharacterized protein n=1 Tax=Pyxicephalus adspersus TaxID=30357 RepID=A0AAV3AN03_PYXAD|nr:TPA: hypothetical protein GDO54_008433 [Pyxicephalus adspersus]
MYTPFIQPTTKQALNQQKQEKAEEKPKNTLRPEFTPSSMGDKKLVIPTSENKKETNNLEVDVEEKKATAAILKSKQDDKNKEDVQEAENQINPDNVNAGEDEDEPKLEDAEYKESNKENEEVERENLINIDGQQEDDNGTKQNEQEDARNPNDYNGDEANVAESEAEKQAELTDNKQIVKDDIVQNGLNGQAAEEEAEDSDTPPLK